MGIISRRRGITIIVIGIILALAGLLTAFRIKDIREIETMGIENIDLEEHQDGFYRGTYKNGDWTNTVDIHIRDGRIIDIRIMEKTDLYRDIGEQVIKRVIEEQGTDIDVVTGATANTKVYLKAIENAFDYKK